MSANPSHIALFGGVITLPPACSSTVEPFSRWRRRRHVALRTAAALRDCVRRTKELFGRTAKVLSVPIGRKTGHPPRSAVVLFGAAVLVPIVLFGLAAWNDHRQAMHRAERDAQRTVAALHEHATKVLETQELILDRIAERVADKDWDEISASERNLHEYLRQMMLPQVFNIFLTDARGRPRVNAVMAPVSPEADLSDRPYFVEQRSARRGTFIGGVVKERLSGSLTFHASRRLSEPDGSFSGVIAVAMRPDYFTNFWRSFAPARDHFVSLVREDGELLARQPALGSEPLTLSSASALIRSGLSRSEGTYHGRSPLDGVSRIIAFKKLEKYPLYVVYGYGYPTILLGWYRNLVFYGVAALLAAASLTLVIRYALQTLWAEQQALLRLNTETQRREQIQAELVHAQKLEAIGAMTSAIAHDFGNFLQVIVLSLHVLKGRMNDKRLEARVEACLQASQGATKLRQQLLAFARKQPCAPIVLNINDVFRDFLPILSHAVESTVAIRTRLADDLWPALLDKDRLEVVLLNLAVNARHAMPSGGTLTIETRNVSLPRAGTADDLAGPFVAITVSDTGTGMSPDVAARAFEPFFTTKEEGRGTGLGLPAVHALAKEFGGTATIDSTVERGTRVNLYFPRAVASLTALDEKTAVQERRAERDGRCVPGSHSASGHANVEG